MSGHNKALDCGEAMRSGRLRISKASNGRESLEHPVYVDSTGVVDSPDGLR